MALTLPADRGARPPRAQTTVPPLENGAHLPGREFLRRYEAMPELKKAELVDGIVYMASPVRLDQHGAPDSLLQTWLGTYAIATPGVQAASNTTVRLGPDDVPQPDGLLRLRPECGGRSRVDSDGYLHGAPELVVEIAASSASADTRQKLAAYRRAGVREYLVWRTEDGALDWWKLEEDEYRPIPPDAAAGGLLRSELFPGLVLDVAALLSGDGHAVLTALQAGLRGAEHTAFAATLRGQVDRAAEAEG